MAMRVGELRRITITRPDDWHLHLRDGAQMRDAVRSAVESFARAIVMPNLKPPVTSVSQASAYYENIRAVAKEWGHQEFVPLMTLYLTDHTTPKDIREAKASELVHAVKYYPAGATTNSENGVTKIENAFRALDEMQKHDLLLLIHGEATDPGVDVFDREEAFIERVLTPLVAWYPGLKIVLEHLTTAFGVAYVKKMGPNVAATITAHHLLCNRNDMLGDGIKPHLYCKPVLKREEDRQALLEAATSGNPSFFLGTDSAPHPQHLKEHPCGYAGCFTGHAALELYAEAFDSVGALDKLEGFASHFGADFYGLPRNHGTVTLVNNPWKVSGQMRFGDSIVVPFRAGEMVQWKVE